MKTRSRLVTFRLSTEEYEQLEQVCVSSGSRSISEFARSAVMHRVSTRTSQKPSLGEDLATLSERLRELDTALKELSGWIGRILGSANASASTATSANALTAGGESQPEHAEHG